MRQHLVDAIREMRPILPRKGWYRYYAIYGDGVSIDRSKWLVAATRLVRGTMEVDEPLAGAPGERGHFSAGLPILILILERGSP